MRMKTYINRLVCAGLLFISVQTYGQSDDAAENRRILEEKNFIFIPQQVNPQRGISRPVTSYYEFVVKPDTVSAYLPYFGRAYSAPIDPTQGGIRFTSTDYSYKMSGRKKKGYEIVVVPKDASGISTMRLTAYENGRASLQVTQTTKDPIYFNGYFIAGPERAKKAF